jgi:beta-glucanase (GH16 family)
MQRFFRASLGLVLLCACSGSTQINTPQKTLVALSVTPSALTLSLGQSQALSVTGHYSDATTATITDGAWSTAGSVVSVSSSGTVLALSAGAAVVTVTKGGLSASAGVAVSAGIPAVLQSISLGTAALSINTGATTQLQVLGTYSDGSVAPLFSGVAWATTDSTIASVSSSGLVTAMKAGSATVSAASGILTATVQVTIVGTQTIDAGHGDAGASDAGAPDAGNDAGHDAGNDAGAPADAGDGGDGGIVVHDPSDGGYDPGAGWTLVWSDEFNGTSLDMNTWNYDLGAGGWGNNESEYYAADNAVVANGLLTITAKVQNMGDAPYTSARIQTAQKKTFLYGKLSMRAKLPYSQAMWPAFWMLGADSNSQGGIYGGDTTWPGCGEIDIMEMIGGLSDGSGDYTTHGTLHYSNAGGRDPGPSYADRYPQKLSQDFHIYELVWTPHSFTWLLDGTAFGTKIVDSDMTALNKPMFVLINLAIGGAWGGWVNASTVFPQSYQIDYVREYTNASITAGGAEGLSSTWHLMNGTVSGVTPAGEDLESAPGTVSGFQPVMTLTTPQHWYSKALTGKYETGSWQVALFTTPPSGASVVKAEVFLTNPDGSSAVSLGAATLDTAGQGNHRNLFQINGVPALTLSNQRILVVLTPVSGVPAQMIYNGNDFDSVLSAPWSSAN